MIGEKCFCDAAVKQVGECGSNDVFSVRNLFRTLVFHCSIMMVALTQEYVCCGGK